jgi:anti-anti-sigma factor
LKQSYRLRLPKSAANFSKLAKEVVMAANPVPLPDLNLEIINTPEETIVRCTGKITSNTCSILQTTVRSLIPHTKTVVLDLTDVKQLDSSGLGAIVGLYLSAKRQRCSLRLIHLNQRLQELFRITKLTSMLEGHEDFLGFTPD